MYLHRHDLARAPQAQWPGIERVSRSKLGTLAILSLCAVLFFPRLSVPGENTSDRCIDLGSLTQPLRIVCSAGWECLSPDKIRGRWPEPLEEHECQSATHPSIGCTVLLHQGKPVAESSLCSTTFDFAVEQGDTSKHDSMALRGITLIRSWDSLAKAWDAGLSLVNLVNSSLQCRLCDTAQWRLDESGKENIFRCERTERLDEHSAYALTVELMVYPSGNLWTLRFWHGRAVVEWPTSDKITAEPGPCR
jgi:hypothetical protein